MNTLSRPSAQKDPKKMGRPKEETQQMGFTVRACHERKQCLTHKTLTYGEPPYQSANSDTWISELDSNDGFLLPLPQATL